jgi:Membrane-associated phospholipid phosphatase
LQSKKPITQISLFLTAQMYAMLELFKRNRYFFIPYLLLLGICGFLLLSFSKASIHLYINKFHAEFFDYFFKYLTNLGDGIFLPVLLVIILYTAAFRDGIFLVSVFLIAGLIVQILKRTVFSDLVRPAKYFGESAHLHLVNGVEQLCCNSFPSGHSATAFGFYLCFAIIFKNRWMKLAMFVLASLVAFSRVYLSQHFLIDIFTGSIIGTITTLACYFWIYSLKGKWLDMNIKVFNRR